MFIAKKVSELNAGDFGKKIHIVDSDDVVICRVLMGVQLSHESPSNIVVLLADEGYGNPTIDNWHPFGCVTMSNSLVVVEI